MNKLYLLKVDFTNKTIESLSMSYKQTLWTSSVSSYASNFGFIQNTKGIYAFGFARTIADKNLAYNIFAVFDLKSSQKEEQTPGTGLLTSKPITADILRDPNTVKNTLALSSALSLLPSTSPIDYWKNSDMWAPYLTTINKGNQNYKGLGFFGSKQD